MSDQIDLPNEKFDTLQETVYTYSDTNKTRLGIIASIMITFLALRTSWISLWGQSKDKKNSTQVDRENTSAIKAKYVTFLRTFVKQNYYDNPAATTADILAAGLKPHASHHPLGKQSSTEVPAVTVTPMKGHLLNVSCMNSKGSIAKPDKIVFIRIKWFMGAVVPTNPSLFTFFSDFTKHPIQLAFEAEDQGKPLAIIVCYINKDGSESTYCPVINTIVP